MSAATMNTIHHHNGNYFGCCPPLQQQTPSCCTTSQSPQQQPSSSSSSSTCTTMISTHEALTQVPNTDISRLSFYLRCCVIGCGLVANTDTIPVELLDFTSAHLLPQQYQHMICRLVFEDFSLGNLLNTIIYVDDDDDNNNNNQQQVLLPPGIATMFVKPGTTEYTLCMNQLQQLGSSNLPTFFNGNVMICTSEWLQSFHVQPFQRYLATMMLNNTTSCTNFNNDQQQDLVNTAASLLLSMNNNNNDDHDQQQQHHDEEEQEQEDHQHNYKKVETNIQLDYYGHSDQDDMDIPMAAAVPLMDNETSSSSSSPAASSSESMSGENDYDDVSSSLITPGQQVRLFGLETEEMNNVIGYVSERKDNRVIVNVPNHSCKYSVRIENLMIIVQEAYCEIEE